MCKADIGITGAFMMQLFQEAARKVANPIMLEITSFGEGGDQQLSFGPHPGFHPRSIVLNFGTDNGGGYQCHFAEEDVDTVRQLCRALQGWIAFIDAKHAQAMEGE
jgi:hypothetical protein